MGSIQNSLLLEVEAGLRALAHEFLADFAEDIAAVSLYLPNNDRMGQHSQLDPLHNSYMGAGQDRYPW